MSDIGPPNLHLMRAGVLGGLLLVITSMIILLCYRPDREVATIF